MKNFLSLVMWWIACLFWHPLVEYVKYGNGDHIQLWIDDKRVRPGLGKLIDGLNSKKRVDLKIWHYNTRSGSLCNLILYTNHPECKTEKFPAFRRSF